MEDRVVAADTTRILYAVFEDVFGPDCCAYVRGRSALGMVQRIQREVKRGRASASTPPTTEALTPAEWAPHASWRTVAWSQGSHQKLQARAARIPVPVVDADGADTDEAGWLVLERRGTETKAWFDLELANPGTADAVFTAWAARIEGAASPEA